MVGGGVSAFGIRLSTFGQARRHCRLAIEDWRLENSQSSIENRPLTILLDGEDFPASQAGEEGLDIATRDQPLDFAIGECRVREGMLTFHIGAEGQEALKPPARSRPVG